MLSRCSPTKVMLVHPPTVAGVRSYLKAIGKNYGEQAPVVKIKTAGRVKVTGPISHQFSVLSY